MTKEEAPLKTIAENEMCCIIFTVDGVLADSSLTIDVEGNELFKSFNAKDGLVMQLLPNAGLELAIITG